MLIFKSSYIIIHYLSNHHSKKSKNFGNENQIINITQGERFHNLKYLILNQYYYKYIGLLTEKRTKF